MTNGRGAGMASFMTKKKKYKFQVDVCIDELLEVPFVSAVLFAKLRLLDGGSFQDHSSRMEVQDHTVKWGANFSFPCKMMANASTGVLERCVLRISVRKECKGGRSFTKLGFVDLNLAEFAGAGVTSKKALLEGYDTRHRQDNSMLRFSIKMNMLSGDILFKVPSPSLKHKVVSSEEAITEPRPEEYSSGSLAGSIASGSSGFGSLPKRRPALLSSDLVIGHTLPENSAPTVITTIENTDTTSVPQEHEDISCEHGHSRNSSNTSQLSKASGYSSIHSHTHSRQSSSGDSGHIRNLHWLKRAPSLPNPSFNMKATLLRINTYPNKCSKLLQTPSPTTTDEIFSTPKGNIMPEPKFPSKNSLDNNRGDRNSSGGDILSKSDYSMPKGTYKNQISNTSSVSDAEYVTPDSTFTKIDIENYNQIQKSCSCSFVEQRVKNMSTIKEKNVARNSDDINMRKRNCVNNNSFRSSLDSKKENDQKEGVLRSKSEFQIPRKIPTQKSEGVFQNFVLMSDSLLSFLTPRPKRKLGNHSTPKKHSPTNSQFKIPDSPILHLLRSLPETRTTSLSSLRSGISGTDGQQLYMQQVQRGLPHRKLLEGTSGGKLAPLAISPDETPSTVPSDCAQNNTIRRTSVTTNPSSSSLVLSETGSLDRAKAALERRKKAASQDNENVPAPGRVEVTRVNPDQLIADLLKNTNLEQADDSAETSGLQLFIAKDGTAALGNHEVKSQMSTGVQVFKQVVMDDNR